MDNFLTEILLDNMKFQSSNIVEYEDCESEMEDLKQIIFDKLNVSISDHGRNQYLVTRTPSRNLHTTTTNQIVRCYVISKSCINDYFLDDGCQISIVTPYIDTKLLQEETSVHSDENSNQHQIQL
ncbi:unnamed protein product [Adineta ricciae]|uniref:Uncharacterized protein n=1 Tax=Adineta ricciae TaxID=249248 RepID=A0A815TAI1_ADIRI|nr:unnamed protein product [Adineta ricciae]